MYWWILLVYGINHYASDSYTSTPSRCFLQLEIITAGIYFEILNYYRKNQGLNRNNLNIFDPEEHPDYADVHWSWPWIFENPARRFV
jgi:hypothetical protein